MYLLTPDLACLLRILEQESVSHRLDVVFGEIVVGGWDYENDKIMVNVN